MPTITEVEEEYEQLWLSRRKKKTPTERVSWCAPEHEVYSLGMERDKAGNLILDPRPWIMRPDRPKIDMSLFLEAHI